jgi:hypothetical protein
MTKDVLKKKLSRERQEAIRFAQQIAEENKRLKTTLTSGEEDLYSDA